MAEHIAIMKKSWGLLPKILTGEKQIESRWYRHKCEAWDKVKPGDTIYFKDSGEPVTVRAKAGKVLQFADLQPSKVRQLLGEYGSKDGIASSDLDYFYSWAKDKKYCVLVFLEQPARIEPFQIDKTGFGAPRAWLTVENIGRIKVTK